MSEKGTVMFKVWVRDTNQARGQVLTTSASLKDVEAICQSMNDEGVAGYNDVLAAWGWVTETEHCGRVGLEIVLSGS